jgi:hypothetical protein
MWLDSHKVHTHSSFASSTGWASNWISQNQKSL